MAFEDGPVNIDWSRTGTPRIGLRTILMVAGLVVLGGLFAYDYVVVGAEPVIFGYDISRLEWLWIASLWIALLYVGWPAIRDRDRTVAFVRRLWDRPAAFLAGLFVAGVFLAGTVAPLILSQPVTHFRYSGQPPVFTSVTADIVVSCHNPVGDRCFGSWRYPLGTNAGGKGYLTLLVFGARAVVMYSTVAVTFIVSLATLVGTTSAYLGGRIDRFLMSVAETLKIIPGLLVFLVWGWLTGNGSLFMLVVSFGAVNWANAAILVRSRALNELSKLYVTRAEAAGAGTAEIVRWHLIPNVVRTAVSIAIYQIPLLITIEATLAFLEVGPKQSPLLLLLPTIESWGNLIGEYIGEFGAYWWYVVNPIGALFLTILSLNVLASGLEAILDPRSE